MAVVIKELLSQVKSQLSSEQLTQEVMNILCSQQTNDEIQMPLIELLGFEILETEAIPIFLQMRDELKQQKQVNQNPIQQKQTPTLKFDNLVQNVVKGEKQERQKVSQVSSSLVDISFIPHNQTKIPQVDLVDLKQLPEYFKQVFDDIPSFNAMQSQVYQTAYKENCNLLISAPTSAGKTNVALLCILKMVQQYLEQNDLVEQYVNYMKNGKQPTNKKQKFKSLTTHACCQEEKVVIEEGQHPLSKCNHLCVYLTPLKALASEITQKFSHSLQQLGLRVLECTGDESPPQQLIDNANVLILTPEKFDVITRKVQSEEPIYKRQQLLIIDEIHLLGVPTRGPVVETIVCRTLEAVETLQTPLRMVGISATIPNYNDIQKFMRVPNQGLFVFGDEYRPVPMSQCIVSVKQQTQQALQNPSQMKPMEISNDAKIAISQNNHFEEIINQCQQTQNSLVDTLKTPIKPNKENPSKSQNKGMAKIFEQENVLDEIAINMCVQNAINQHPTLLFVHSRRKTVELALRIAELILRLNYYNEKACVQAQGCEKGALSKCVQNGVGFHNAQLDKSYRSLVEKLFRAGELTVVVCTATLAWGVNLPSQTVIIRGTEVFTDHGRQDLDILDIRQIFGRAGRPQYTQKGEIGRGIILTTNEKSHQYIRLLNNETVIDSQMGDQLPDVLNAEIVLGNISTIQNAFDYIKKTFYYVRITNTDDQILYALSRLQKYRLVFCEKPIGQNQPSLVITPTELGQICSYYYINFKTLFNFLEQLKESAIGNVITHEDLMHFLSSVPQFASLKARQDEQQELMELSGSQYQQMNEIVAKAVDSKKSSKQINKIVNAHLKTSKNVCHLIVQAKEDEPQYKTSILIQAFISRFEPKSASLQADSRLIIQQIGRISQALFEVLLTFKRYEEAMKMLDITNSIMYQSWYDNNSPLTAFVQTQIGITKNQYDHQVQLYSQDKNCPFIQKSTISTFNTAYQERLFSYESFMSIEFDDMKAIIGQENARQVCEARKYVPQLDFDVISEPVSEKIIRIQITGTACFKWLKNCHGYEQEFLIVVAREDNGLIVHQQKVLVNEDNYKEAIKVTVLIKVNQWNKIRIGQKQVSYSQYVAGLELEDDDLLNDAPPVLKVSVLPILWTGGSAVRQSKTIEIKKLSIQNMDQLHYKSQENSIVSFQNKIQQYFTPLPKVQPLSIKALHWQEAEKLFQFTHFNPLQSVMFHQLYFDTQNVFVGAPTSCGKTVASEIAILQVLKNSNHLKCIYIAPLKALVRERFDDWTDRFGKIGVKIIELTGETLPTAKSLMEANILVATPEKFDAVSRQWGDKEFLKLIGLIVFDEVHLIGTGRGYVLESIVSRFLQYSQKTRLIGMSTASSNANDIAKWLKVPMRNIFNFDSNARPVRLSIHIQGYIGEAYCPRMELMNKPVYAAIKKHSPNLPVLIFVSSRRQTRKTAFSLLQQAQLDPQAPQCFWKNPNEDIAVGIEDLDAAQCLKYGIGIHHAAMSVTDRNSIQKYFTNNQITVLVCTATLAWGINVPAYMTILKGCEYFDKASGRYIEFDISEINQMCGRAGRPQFIQQRYEQWILEYFGEDTMKQLKKKDVFNAMYKFNKQLILQNLSNKTDEAVIQILDELEQRDKNTPQAVSVIMCKQQMKEFYKQFISDPLPFESSLLNSTCGNALAAAMMKCGSGISHFPDLINAEIASQGQMSLVQLRNWLQLSFLFLRARKNPMLYGINLTQLAIQLEDIELSQFDLEFQMYSNGKSISGQPREILLDFFVVLEIYRILDQQLQMLIDSHLIECVNPEDPYLKHKFAKCALGDITSRFYLSHKTVPHFVREFFDTDRDFIEVLCESIEFKETPVRKTENVEMLALTNQLGLKSYKNFKGVDQFTSTEAKTFFLLQCQFRAKQKPVVYPNQDYKLDLYQILDTSIRICASLCEVAKVQKAPFFKLKQILEVSQKLIQGCDSVQKEKQLPNLHLMVFGRLVDCKDKLLELDIQFINKNQFTKPTFKSEFYIKTKPSTFYIAVGETKALMEVVRFPNCAKGNSTKCQMAWQRFVHVCVDSDLFIGVEKTATIDCQHVGKDWSKLYDSEENEINITIE